MTVGERNFTPEERAAGLLFRLRDSLKSRDRVERGGATLVGSGTTFGASGMTLDGNGNLSYAFSSAKTFRAAMTIVFKFTPTRAADSGAQEVFIDSATQRTLIFHDADNALKIYAGATVSLVNIALATYQSYWLQNQQNTLTVSFATGGTTIWLNGTQIGTSAVAFSMSRTSTLYIGASSITGGRFSGTIHSIEIWGNAATAVDEPYLRNGNLIQKLDEPLIVLPGTSAWRDTTDSNKYKTEVRGKAGITSALLGTTGLVTTEFPKVAREAGLARGFSFDGGDSILVQNAQQLAFPDPAPFTVAMLVENLRQIASGAGANVGGYLAEVRSTVGSPVVVPWFIDFYESSGNVSLRFQTFDGAVARGAAYTVSIANSGWLRKKLVLVCVFDGTTWRIYIDGVQVASTVVAGCFAGASSVLYFGSYGSNLAVRPYLGRETLPCVYDFAASPMQTKALTARLRYQARRG